MNVFRKQPFFYLLLAIVAYLSFLVLKPYFSAIVLAFLAVLFFKPVYSYFVRCFKGRTKIASSVSVVIIVFAVLIPIVLIGGLTANQILQFRSDIGSSDMKINYGTIADYGNRAVSIIPGIDYQLSGDGIRGFVERGAKAIGTFFLERLPDIGSGAFNAVTWIIIFIILTYSLFPLHGKLLEFVARVSPLEDRIDTVYVTRVIEMSKSMVRGTFLIAVVQGIVAGLLLAITGVPYVLFWTLLMIFLSVIPMVGYGFVMIPIAIVTLLTGGIWQGIVLILGSVLIVGNIDNFLRPRLVSKKAELHPALIILGVIGGLQVFGVLGFIYGPVIMILLVTTFEMYLKYFRASHEDGGPAAE
ncbi:MAG: AI-2E family transporter [Patescibacteria group bacterium]